jgi:hypothetical protein
MPEDTNKLLSEFPFTKNKFENIENILSELEKDQDFLKLNDDQKYEMVSKTLYELIDKFETPCFLLSNVIDYISLINDKKILPVYNLNNFERWLNQLSNLSDEQNLFIRAKIVGKYIPRDEYQSFFPIGMKNYYEGAHFVTAHKSPDLDSTIAAFWGWVDAFGARVSKGMHIWNVPGGIPKSSIEMKLGFEDVFGRGIYKYLLKERMTLTLSGYELMNVDNFSKKDIFQTTSISNLESRDRAVVITDKDGYYIGDLRSFDVEGVRQIVMLLNNCLRWFESHLQINLVSLFAKKDLNSQDIPNFIKKIFGLTIEMCDPAKEYSDQQKLYLTKYLEKVLLIKSGIKATFEEFAASLKEQDVFDFRGVFDLVTSIDSSDIFDETGKILEDRPKIFIYLEEVMTKIHTSLFKIRQHFEKVDIALKIKTNVFGYLPHFITINAEVDEIKKKIGSFSYLTVNYPYKKRFLPVGTISARDLSKRFLGSVSLRDFSNPEEMQISSYLEVISIIDHHKSEITTQAPSRTIVSDAQSSNTIISQLVFPINDRYSNFGKCQKDGFFIHEERAFLEYLHFLYGILDDTDLLMKVSNHDIESVANLINRMKSIFMKKEMKIISFDDLKRDENFVKNAADRILKNEDTYSLYNKVYKHKEEGIDQNIQNCIENKESNFFSDTKVLNGCNKIGQSKIFLSNLKTFEQNFEKLLGKWILQAHSTYKEQRQVDLHMHMISTIRSAKEVYKSSYDTYEHRDELWIWIPHTDLAIEHLKSFLFSFQECPNLKGNILELELMGENAKMYEDIFDQNFYKIPVIINEEKSLPIAILRYSASSINSRKTLITPYLPRLLA